MVFRKVQRLPHKLFFGVVAGFVLLMALLAKNGPIGRDLAVSSSVYAFSFLLLGAMLKTFPREWPARRQLVLMIFLATLCRWLFLCFPPSFDLNQYVWEGDIQNKDLNPYVHAIADSALGPFVEETWNGNHHKEASASGPPLAMLIFRSCAWITSDPFFFKAVVILFDLATVVVLAGFIRSRGLPPSRLLIYALNPLVLLFIAGEGHMDSIPGFFVCSALFFFARRKEKRAFFCLGCAVMGKYLALVLLPFLVNRSNWKKSYTFLVPLLCYLPFTDSGTGPLGSLIPFGSLIHYNDSLTVILRAILGPVWPWGALILLSLCLGMVFLLVHDPLRSSYVAAGTLLVFLPTLHPWHLIFITPFLVFYPSRAWLYLHFAVVFTFPVLYVEYQTGVFQEIYWLKIPEYLPFYALLAWGLMKPQSFRGTTGFQPVKTFSVVIPTLNEAESILGAVGSLRGEVDVLETVVADGGSSDDTCDLARKVGAKLVQSRRGRGFQINEGINACRGDVILILHADCRIRSGTLERTKKTLNGNLQLIGGCLAMRYDDDSFRNRFLASLNNARARWTGLAFGDQGQFFRAEALTLMGGYPDQMLMEDVELSFRLKETGPVCCIAYGIEVSGRRWQKMGFWRNGARVLILFLTYLVYRRLGVKDPSAESFYSRYYTENDTRGSN